MQCSNLQSRLLSSGKFPSLISFISSPCQIGRNSRLLRYRDISRFNSLHTTIRSQTSNVSIGGGDYEGGQGKDNHKIFSGSPTSASNSSSEYAKPNTRVPFPILVAGVLLGCALAFSLVSFLKGGPSAVLAAIAKSGFTAAFTLIFVSEIGDKAGAFMQIF